MVPFQDPEREWAKVRFRCWQLRGTDQLLAPVLTVSILWKVWMTNFTGDHLNTIIRVGSSERSCWNISGIFPQISRESIFQFTADHGSLKICNYPLSAKNVNTHWSQSDDIGIPCSRKSWCDTYLYMHRHAVCIFSVFSSTQKLNLSVNSHSVSLL